MHHVLRTISNSQGLTAEVLRISMRWVWCVVYCLNGNKYNTIFAPLFLLLQILDTLLSPCPVCSGNSYPIRILWCRTRGC